MAKLYVITLIHENVDFVNINELSSERFSLGRWELPSRQKKWCN